jgi:hypothetical protein
MRFVVVEDGCFVSGLSLSCGVLLRSIQICAVPEHIDLQAQAFGNVETASRI